MRRPAQTRIRRDPLSLAFAGLVMGACLFDGRISGLVVTAAFAALTLARLSREPGVPAPPAAPLALFAVGLAAAALGASPLAPGGVHPLWSLLGPGGAAAIDLEGDGLGLLSLLGLGLAFWLGFQGGVQSKTARGLIMVMMSIGLALEAAALLACLGTPPGPLARILEIVPLTTDASLRGAGLRGAVFGVLMLLGGEGVLQALAATSAPRGGLFVRLRAVPLSLTCAVASLLCLALISTPAAAAIGLTMLVLQVSWSLLLTGRGQTPPRRLLLWLALGSGVLAAAIAMLAAARLLPPPKTVLAQASAWAPFWASPWLGYGLGSQDEAARLFMTRLSLGVSPPPSAFLAWLEQGGVLTVAPLSGALAWSTGALLLGSVRQSRTSSLIRAIVCASLFLALLAVISPAPGDFAIAAIWTALLGIGAGAGRSS